MAFKALVQDGTVYLVPAALDVPPERRDQLRPLVFASAWDKVPVSAAPPVGSCADAPAPQVLPAIEVTAEAPTPAPAADASPSGEAPRSERRKAR